MITPAGVPPAPRTARRSSLARWLAATCAAVMCLGFLALGTWQLYRLQWKLALIERVDQRVHAAAVAAPPVSLWPQVSKESDEYRHVLVQGHYLAGADALVQATTIYGSGFWLMTPFCTKDGAIVFINRGFVAPARAKPLTGPTPLCAATSSPSIDTVTGLLRMPEPGGGYLRKNDAAADRWFSRDVAAIGAARGLSSVAPYFIDRAADPRPADGTATETAGLVDPVGGLTVISFPNSHLVYALTWYALALLAAGGGYLLLRAPRRASL